MIETIAQPPELMKSNEGDDREPLFHFHFMYTQVRWHKASPLIREICDASGSKFEYGKENNYASVEIGCDILDADMLRLVISLAESCTFFYVEGEQADDFLWYSLLRFQTQTRSTWQQFKDTWQDARRRIRERNFVAAMSFRKRFWKGMIKSKFSTVFYSILFGFLFYDIYKLIVDGKWHALCAWIVTILVLRYLDE